MYIEINKIKFLIGFKHVIFIIVREVTLQITLN